jgi:hypothetical protein
MLCYTMCMNVTNAKLKIREITNTTTSDYSEASLVRDLNSELTMVQVHILRDRGVLEFDASSYTDLPIADITLVAGQSVYKITEDQNSNEITTIHKVAINTGGGFVDVQRKQVAEGSQEVLTAQNTSPMPRHYYEVGNSIVLADIPSQGGTIRVWFDRALPQVLVSDTTLELPVPSAYHNLVCYKVGLNYAIDKGLSNVSTIAQRVQMEEDRLSQYEANRRADEATVMSVEVIRGL